MNSDIRAYHKALAKKDKAICDALHAQITEVLTDAESKVWHRHPVWFLEGNPVVGYYKLKRDGTQLLFWSGQSFDEPNLIAKGKSKAAGITYVSLDDINRADLRRWLQKSVSIQWDYKNITKNKGELHRV